MVTTYQQLCPVCFGVGAVAEIGQKAKGFGAEKVLCVYGQSVKKAGIADKVIGYLKDAGLFVDTFEGVLSDVPDTMVNEAGANINGKGYQLIVGIGGGSSMDTAKALSILADHPLPISQYLASNGGEPILGSDTKLILVPTTSGTGSEVTIMGVVHDLEHQVKDVVRRPPDLAIVDPELSVTAPPSVTASCAMDAISHAIEAYTSVSHNLKADLLALHAIQLISENLEAAYQNGTDLDARTALSFASNIAGIAFCDASVHMGHCAAHEMGVRFQMPHGVACAIATPVTIEYCADALPEGRIQKLAKALGVANAANLEAAEAGKKAAEAVRDLMRRTNIPSLKEMGHDREAVLACAKGAIEKNWFHVKTPKPMNVEIMRALMADMYDKY